MSKVFPENGKGEHVSRKKESQEILIMTLKVASICSTNIYQVTTDNKSNENNNELLLCIYFVSSTVAEPGGCAAYQLSSDQFHERQLASWSIHRIYLPLLIVHFQ